MTARSMMLLCFAPFVLAGCGSAPPAKQPVAPASDDDDKPRPAAPKAAAACSESEDGVLSLEESAAKKVRYVRYCGVADDKLEDIDALVHVKTGSPLDLEKLSADHDKDSAEDEGEDDSKHEQFLLHLFGDAERRHDDEEDEDVVDRE